MCYPITCWDGGDDRWRKAASHFPDIYQAEQGNETLPSIPVTADHRDQVMAWGVVVTQFHQIKLIALQKRRSQSII